MTTTRLATMAVLALIAAIGAGMAQDAGPPREQAPMVALESVTVAAVPDPNAGTGTATVPPPEEWTASADVLGCKPLTAEGYLIVIVDGIAVVIGSRPIPYEPGSRLAERYHVTVPDPRHARQLVFRFHTADSEQRYWTTVRSTPTQLGCAIVPTWDDVLRHIQSDRPKHTHKDTVRT